MPYDLVAVWHVQLLLHHWTKLTQLYRISRTSQRQKPSRPRAIFC